MITFFNKLANSWVAKCILGLLALSMLAFWGLGGLANLSQFDASTDIIQVGKHGVSAQALNQSFDTARKTLGRLAGGKYISPADAIQNGVFNQVIDESIALSVQENAIDEMGLAASNAAISAYVERNPVFRDAAGNFDKNLFYAYLMQTGLSETQLAARLKKELAYKHLQDSIQGLGYAPALIVKAQNIYQNEKRTVQMVSLRPENRKLDITPTEKDLTDYYEAYAEDLMNPEFRSLTVVALTPDMMLNRVQVAQADVDAVYEEKKDTYNKPEERDLYQMFFKEKEAAESAAKEATPENFEKLAAEKTSQSADETHFGLTQKNQLMEELSEPVFAAQKNAIVGPVQSQAGWHILWVKDIKASETTPEADVKAEIKKQLAAEKTYDALEDLTRQLEDELGAGTSLKEAAKKLDIQTVAVKETDIAGNLSDGTMIADALKNQELLQNVFILKKGDVSGLIKTDNGYLVAEIDEITPVAQKPFESVKNEVKALWLKDKQTADFADWAKGLFEKAKSGVALSEIAKTDGTHEEEELTLTRAEQTALPAEVLATIFHQGEGIENISQTPVNNGIIITVVTKIEKPNMSDNEDVLIENTKKASAQALVDGFSRDYMDSLNIRVNQDALQDLIGQYRKQD